jgi:hypothetical protein
MLDEGCANKRSLKSASSGPERQERGMFMVFDHPILTSSDEGAAYRHSYVAPPELGLWLGSLTIDITRLRRSGSETIDSVGL